MLKMEFKQPELKTIMCIGAHCDDIEIGCGGTLLRLAEENPGISVHWYIFSSDPVREQEVRQSAKYFLDGCSGKVTVKGFRNGFFPYIGGEIKEYFEEIKQAESPDLIFTHYRDDRHQDHRLLSDLTWNTFRDNLIFEYEVPKYDGDIGVPNFFMQLGQTHWEKKIEIIIDCYKSQVHKHWFSAETFSSLMRLRGMECAAPSGYAEAFYCRKLTI
jgi:LmbE family N-acetylglucosaminyl deacetylase